MPRKVARKPKAPSAKLTPESQANEDATPTPVRGKIEQVLDLLRRETGATLSDLTDVTGWLPHSTRAMLTGLQKKGHLVERQQREGVSCYHIASAS